jgi:hypothetical protein
MRYLVLVYVEQATFDAMSARENQAVTNAALAHDEELRSRGHLVMASALDQPDAALTVRVREGKVSVTDGPFAETKEHLGGFLLVEARDLNEAVRLASEAPMARYGSLEVRPLRTIEARDLDTL